MSSEAPRPGQTFEISVVGTLGPVVRHALLPCGTGEASYQTVLRVAGGEDGVAELVAWLTSMGLELSEVALVS